MHKEEVEHNAAVIRKLGGVDELLGYEGEAIGYDPAVTILLNPCSRSRLR